MANAPDVDALDAALANANQPEYYVRGCAVGRLVAGLDAGPFRDRLIERMREPVQVVGHTALSKAIKETTGISVKPLALMRHRARGCTCSNEVWQ